MSSSPSDGGIDSCCHLDALRSPISVTPSTPAPPSSDRVYALQAAPSDARCAGQLLRCRSLDCLSERGQLLGWFPPRRMGLEGIDLIDLIGDDVDPIGDPPAG